MTTFIQGMSGMASLNGRAAGADGPRYVPMVMADKISGTVLASSVGMALYARERRRPRPGAAAVPMLDTVLAFMLPEHLVGCHDRRCGGGARLHAHADPASPAVSDLPTGTLCLIAVTDAQWARFLRVIERPELIRRSAFRWNHGEKCQHRFRLRRGRGGAAAAHHGGMAAPF